MLPFLARTFLLLAAAFGLGVFGGRGARAHKRRAAGGGRSAPSGLRGAAPADPALSVEPPVEIVSMPTTPVTPKSPGPDAAAAMAFDAEGGERQGSSTRDVPVGQPAFAGYGSGFVAGVILSDVPPEDASTRSSGASVPLAAPDVHGRTPAAEQRQALPDDPLDARHGADPLDFRTVDYGNAKAAERTASEARFRDDGWTIPEGASLPPHGSLDEGPAAFKSGGGSGAVFGAPETEIPQTESDAPAHPAGETPHAAAAHPGDTEIAAVSDTPVSRFPRARDGAPDDLTRIRGIGPSIERLLFDNGIFHFEQIAAWTTDEAAWADELSGFRGRVVREGWIQQAKDLVADRTTLH